MECLKKGGMAVLEWLVRQLNLTFDMGCTSGLAWCLYSAPVQREGRYVNVATREALVCEV